MRVHNLHIWVSIVHCNVICNILSLPPLPHEGAVDESKEDFHCRCWGCSECSCNSQAGRPLQLAKFCLDCFEFNSGPTYSVSIVNYVSDHSSVYLIYHLLFQSPSFPKCASACPEGLVGLIDDLIHLLFSCQSLV
jgi:hypothetical protein